MEIILILGIIGIMFFIYRLIGRTFEELEEMERRATHERRRKNQGNDDKP